MICITCQKEFDERLKKNLRGGFYDECPECGFEDRQSMYLGRAGGLDGKGAGIVIFKTDLINIKGYLKKESASGFSPGLGISHPKVEQARIDFVENKNDFMYTKKQDKERR